MPMNWNDQADAKLLIGIMKTAKPKIDYDALAAYMGGECTAYAIQHRIRKIQAKANEGGDDATATSPVKAASTPTKAKKPSTPRKAPAKKTPKRKSTKEDTMDDVADEDEASPSKKVKSETIKEEDVVKEENDSGGDEA